MIAVTSISKSLGRKRILSNVSLSVRGGEIVGISGPIGAGKSTLLFLLNGLLAPDRGTISMLGMSLERSRSSIAEHANYASSSQRLSGYATVEENMATFARLYGILNYRAVVSPLWKFCGISSGILHKKVFRLSSGENSFVNLTKAILNDPSVLLLDEITAHMDPVLTTKVRSYLKKRTTDLNCTVFVSQNIEEIRQTATRMILLSQGKIVYDGKPLSARQVLDYES